VSALKKYFYVLFLFLTILPITSPVSAGIFIYNAPSSYNENSDRLSSVSRGVYLSTKYLELGYEDTEIVHFDGHVLEQEDTTAVLRYTVNKTLFRFGLHNAVSEDLESKGKSTVIFEVLDYEKNVFGNSLYYTRYRDDTEVWQFASRYGSYFWGDWIPGTLYLQIQGDAISFKSNNEDKKYFSADFKAHLQVNSFLGLEIGGWTGVRRSAVSASGFVVYNRNDLYQSEVRASAGFNLTKSLMLKFEGRVNQRKFPNATQYYNVTTGLIGLNYEF